MVGWTRWAVQVHGRICIWYRGPIYWEGQRSTKTRQTYLISTFDSNNPTKAKQSKRQELGHPIFLVTYIRNTKPENNLPPPPHTFPQQQWQQSLPSKHHQCLLTPHHPQHRPRSASTRPLSPSTSATYLNSPQSPFPQTPSSSPT